MIDAVSRKEAKTFIRVDQLHIIKTVTHAVSTLSAVELLQGFNTTIEGQYGVDVGGLTKEMFRLYFKALFTSGQSDCKVLHH